MTEVAIRTARPARLGVWDRIICIVAPGTGSRRLEDRLTKSLSECLAEQRRADGAEKRNVVLEGKVTSLTIELTNERSLNEKLRTELQTAIHSNKKNQHPLHVDAPADMLRKTPESDGETTQNMRIAKVPANWQIPVIPLQRKPTP